MPVVAKALIDESGPIPVYVGPLQQSREQIAKAGKAHQSFKAKKAFQPEDLPTAKAPAKKAGKS